MFVWCVLVIYIYMFIKCLLCCMYIQGFNEKGKKCVICGEDIQKCVGYYGYIKFVLFVFYIGYFRFIINMFFCICKVRFLVYFLLLIINDCYRFVFVFFYQRQNVFFFLNVFVVLILNFFNVNLLLKLFLQFVRSKIYVCIVVFLMVLLRSLVFLGFCMNFIEWLRW